VVITTATAENQPMPVGPVGTAAATASPAAATAPSSVPEGGSAGPGQPGNSADVRRAITSGPDVWGGAAVTTALRAA